MTPITDTHVHLWDPGEQNLPWLTAVPDLNRPFSLDDYHREATPVGITRAVYVEVDVVPEQRTDEVERVTRACESQSSPVSAMVASADPAAPDFSALAERLAKNPWVRGVRRVLHTPATPPGYCLQPQFVEGVQLLGKLGLTFDLCMRRSNLGDALELVRSCPDTHFILDHCGNAQPGDDGSTEWGMHMQAIATTHNCVCKLSGIAVNMGDVRDMSTLEPIVEACVTWFGPERVMFGSDWPVCTLRTNIATWADLVRRVVAPLGDDVSRRVLYDNATRVYGLAVPSTELG